MKLTLFIKKIMIYVAQDSLKALNCLGKTLMVQVEDLTKALHK